MSNVTVTNGCKQADSGRTPRDGMEWIDELSMQAWPLSPSSSDRSYRHILV